MQSIDKMAVLISFEAFYYGNKPNYFGFEVGVANECGSRSHKEAYRVQKNINPAFFIIECVI